MALQVLPHCTGCGACLSSCPNGAVLPAEPVYHIAALLCTECLGYSNRPECSAVCPVQAIAPAAFSNGQSGRRV